jgi:hypothetical protein
MQAARVAQVRGYMRGFAQTLDKNTGENKNFPYAQVVKLAMETYLLDREEVEALMGEEEFKELQVTG